MRTLAEQSLAELNRDIRAALANWDQLFAAPENAQSPGPDVLAAIVAAERMAGVLVRVQVLSDMVIRGQQAKTETEKGVTT